VLESFDLKWLHYAAALAVMLGAIYYFFNRHRMRRSFIYGQGGRYHDKLTLLTSTTSQLPILPKSDHSNPGVQYVGRSHLLDKRQILLMRVLKVAFLKHDILCRVRLGDVIRPAPHLEHGKRIQAYKRIAHLYVDAVICDKESGIIALIDLERKDHSSRRRIALEAYKASCLQQEQFAYIRLDPDKIPRYKTLQELVMLRTNKYHTETPAPNSARTQFMTISLMSKIGMVAAANTRMRFPGDGEPNASLIAKAAD
jgi:Protein of unknown function (DUF2726)